MLKEFNFKSSEADQCVYYDHFNKEKVYIALYVDDVLIMASSQESLNKVLNTLTENFEITSGNAETFVGLKIQRDHVSKTILIHQKSYTDHILAYFDVNQTISVSIPADPYATYKKR